MMMRKTGVGGDRTSMWRIQFISKKDNFISIFSLSILRF